MTGHKPIYFEGGAIILHQDKNKTNYELKVWLNSFNYITLETGVWNDNQDELVNKVSKLRQDIRQQLANSTKNCEKCNKPMIIIGDNIYCFKDKIVLPKSGVVAQ